MSPKLNFTFFSTYSSDNIVDNSRSITELHFNEHFDEIRQRIFHALSFLTTISAAFIRG